MEYFVELCRILSRKFFVSWNSAHDALGFGHVPCSCKDAQYIAKYIR